jgi:DNA-binding PucR family transcriptional regulator
MLARERSELGLYHLQIDCQRQGYLGNRQPITTQFAALWREHNALGARLQARLLTVPQSNITQSYPLDMEQKAAYTYLNNK